MAEKAITSPRKRGTKATQQAPTQAPTQGIAEHKIPSDGAAGPYWRYNEADLAQAFEAIASIGEDNLAILALARQRIGTKATMALALGAARGEAPDFGRMAKGRG